MGRPKKICEAADQFHMRQALWIARTGLGQTGVNPSVGCVIVKKGSVLSRARTENQGRPHAEVIAVGKASGDVRGATLYTTLEPCSHYGLTPPCADMIISSGIKRVVVACLDPDKRVSGQGVQTLKEHKIRVDVGCLQEEVEGFYKGYFLHRRKQRPFVSLKMATSQDEKITPPSGKGWVTCPLARTRGHLERYYHDAILVGIGTVLKDDPLLTCRLPGVSKRAFPRIVLDRQLLLPLNSRLCKSAGQAPLWVLTESEQIKTEKTQKLREKGAEVIDLLCDENGRIDMKDMTSYLACRGIIHLLVEGGAQIYQSFVEHNLCDQLLWFRGSKNFGSGLPALDGIAIKDLPKRFNLSLLEQQQLGEDVLEIYR